MPDDFTRLTWTLLMLVLDREGRALDNIANLRAKMYPLREDVTIEKLKAAFDWFTERGLIVRYTVSGKHYLYQRNFKKYQGDTSREGYSIYPPPPDEQEPAAEVVDETQDEVEEDSGVTHDLLMSNSRPTHELLMTYSRSSSSSASASASSSPPPRQPAPKGAPYTPRAPTKPPNRLKWHSELVEN
jgi:hypothetical protein